MSINLDIEFKPTKRKVKNPLAGAIDVAIRDAEIYGTDLVIKTNRHIERLSPEEMKRRLKSS